MYWMNKRYFKSRMFLFAFFKTETISETADPLRFGLTVSYCIYTKNELFVIDMYFVFFLESFIIPVLLKKTKTHRWKSRELWNLVPRKKFGILDNLKENFYRGVYSSTGLFESIQKVSFYNNNDGSNMQLYDKYKKMHL